MAQPLLHPEILEVVFSHLDGKSLLEASCVCLTWKSVVEHISGVTKLWKQCCEEEITEDVLTDLVTNLFPSLWTSSEDNLTWRTVYSCWVQWHNIGLWPHNVKELYTAPHRKDYITCVKISGSCIITGHSYGGIHMWDCCQGCLGLITKHLKEITDLGLISLPGKKNATYRNVDLKHNYVVSTSLDHTIKVTPLRPNAEPVSMLQQHMQPTTSVRVYQSMFVVTGEDECITVWNLVPHKEDDSLIPTLMYKREDIDDPVDVVSLWRGRITGVTLSNRFYCLMGTDDCSITAGIKGVQKFTQQNDHIVQKYIWRHWICAWLTDLRQLYVTVGVSHTSRQYNTMPALHSYPVCLLLYGELFIMGMESGTLYMYIIQSAEDLLKLDLAAYSWSKSISREPIQCIDVADDRAEPIIVVTTGQKLYYVSLYPS